ncbi:MAG TPA: ABC transporter permease [Stellaceae bacterium]|nr:ABC transporter permease [Stellaceae bacterium]
MLPFILRRLLTAIPSLFGLLIVTFLLIRVVPGDPAAALAGDAATPQQIEAIRHQYGFDRPIAEQLFLYLGKVLRFDFGESQFSHRPVGLDLRQRLPATLELTFAALLMATVLGIPLGVIAAVYHNRWPDFLVRVLSVTGIAVAAFWFAIMLQLVFAMDLAWLPLRGELGSGVLPPPVVTGSLILDSVIAGRWDAFADALRHLVLPTVTLSVGALATITRFARSGVLETLQRDFVLYERAVGYPRWRLIWVYVLRNSVIAAVTQIGLLFGALIGGAVVVEAIFDWPGIGNYTVNAILTADYKVMLAATLLVGVVYTIVNLLTDLVHGWLDPRLWEQL